MAVVCINFMFHVLSKPLTDRGHFLPKFCRTFAAFVSNAQCLLDLVCLVN